MHILCPRFCCPGRFIFLVEKNNKSITYLLASTAARHTVPPLSMLLSSFISVVVVSTTITIMTITATATETTEKKKWFVVLTTIAFHQSVHLYIDIPLLFIEPSFSSSSFRLLHTLPHSHLHTAWIRIILLYCLPYSVRCCSNFIHSTSLQYSVSRVRSIFLIILCCNSFMGEYSIYMMYGMNPPIMWKFCPCGGIAVPTYFPTSPSE